MTLTQHTAASPKPSLDTASQAVSSELSDHKAGCSPGGTESTGEKSHEHIQRTLVTLSFLFLPSLSSFLPSFSRSMFSFILLKVESLMKKCLTGNS